MHTATNARTVPLGDLVAAVFDQAKGFTPAIFGDVARRVVTDMLLHTDNARALRALQRASRSGTSRRAIAPSFAGS
jgi:hypothetical protein